MSSPAVTILIPVYNCAGYVSEAVESILGQTFDDYELLIINDGSTDNTSSIIEQYVDQRIMLVDRPHEGLISALNKGLELARGDYIAIMHADDASHPKRIQKQIHFLKRHPEIGILGTAYDTVNLAGRRLYRVSMPKNDLQVRWFCLLGSPFGHPTVVMRSSVLQANELKYEETFDIVEDYFLWSKVLSHTKGANLSTPLLRYRLHPESRTGQLRLKQLEQHDQVALLCIQQFLPGFEINKEQVSRLRGAFIGGGEYIPDLSYLIVHLCHVYLDMLDAYLYAGQAGGSGAVIRQEVVIRVANKILPATGMPGRKDLLSRLLAMEPALPLLLSWDFLIHRIDKFNRFSKWSNTLQYGN